MVELYLAGCTELFATYGLSQSLRRVDRDERGQHGATYVSVLGATAVGLAFSSTVAIDAHLLAELHPAAAGGALAERDLEDWCRELNNQLVGRVKNKLLRHGLEITAGLPVLMTGSRIDVLGSPEQDCRRYYFATEHGCLTLTLAMVLAPDLQLRQEAAAPAGEEVAREGMHALF